MQKARKFLTALFFNFPILITILQMLRYYLGFISYSFSMINNSTYIGGYMFAQQEIARGRHMVIKNILKKLLKSKKKNNQIIDILEIGSYCGESTIMMGNFLKKKISFNMTCVDVWKSYEQNHSNSFYLSKFHENLDNGNVFRLFKHNIKSSRLSNNVKIIKGDSNKVLNKIKKKFDIVFIDGSHSYQYVKNDIKHSLSKLKNNGILLIDDYEQSYKDSRHLNLKKLVLVDNVDSFYDCKTNNNMHPGVTLAVFEMLGNIKNFNGLLALKFKNKKFENFNRIL